MIIELTKAFIDTQLVVPAGAKKIEFCDTNVRGLLILRIPVQAGQRFQPKLDSDSKASWTPIPAQPGQPKVIT